MSRIPESTVRSIIEGTDIVTLIEEFVRLERRGGRYIGLCPFHAEKTPSFSVDKDKGFFYCFGCHKGGNSVTFLMEHEKLSYREALEELAKRLSIPIDDNEAPTDEEKHRKAMLELYERMAKTFSWLLLEHDWGKKARDYLLKRGIPLEIAHRFMLGYAPSNRSWLFSFLNKKGYSPEFLAHSGLFAERHQGFPLFSDRLMFPIHSPRGETIAFGGRLLSGDGPKYINSPDTLLFSKQENLFAFDMAQATIKKNGYAIICEGYMDAISFHIAGIDWAIAPLGTAFTERQAHLLKRWANLVYLAFDADSAGQKAAEKACLTAALAGLETKIVILPGGKDASEILEKEGAGSLQNVRDLAINGDEFLIRRSKMAFDTTNVEGKARAIASLYPYIEAQTAEVKRDAFFDLIAHEYHVEIQSIRMDYEDAKKGYKYKKKSDLEKKDRSSFAPRTPDLVLMLALVANSRLFVDFRKRMTIDELDDSRAKELFIVLEENYRAEESGLESILARIEDVNLKNNVLASAMSGEFDENAERFIEEGILGCKRRSLEIQKKRIRERIYELGPAGEGLSELQYELMHLDAELAKMKGERDERS